MGFVESLKDKLITKLLENNSSQPLTYMTTGGRAIINQNGAMNYLSDTVQACINSIASEMKKLKPHHLVDKDGKNKIIYDNLEWVLNNPNKYMTTSDFIEYVVWQLFLNYNAFIIPIYNDDMILKSLFPLPQGQYSLTENEEGETFLTCKFAGNLDPLVFRYRGVIHLRKQYSVNQFFGGDRDGRPDTLKIQQLNAMNETLMKNVANSLSGAQNLNGIFQNKVALNQDKLIESMRRLEEMVANNKAGFITTDATVNFTPILKNIKSVDADTLKYINTKIQNMFGCSDAIIKGDFNNIQFKSFFQKVIEPLAITFGDAFSKTLFTENERRSYGHSVKFYAKDSIFMTQEEILAGATFLANQGGLFLNEAREVLGYEPDNAFDGIIMRSLNFEQTNNGDILKAKGGTDSNSKTE